MNESEFKMPKVSIGTQVFWYDHGHEDANPNIATVTRVWDRRVELVFLTSRKIVVCPHMTDPSLEINEHHRDEGAWAHTHVTIEREREISELKQQIQTLRADVAMLKGKLDKTAAHRERMARVRAARKPKPAAAEPAGV